MNSKKLTLSIVIPTFDEEDYLGGCLELIDNQIEKPDEVIVVDNNSTDQTVVVAKRFGFVKVIKESKQGVVFARNRGFDVARGDIIARIDADSRLPVDWVEKTKELMQDESLMAVTGPASGYDLPMPKFNWLPHHLLCLAQSRLPARAPFLFGFNMAIRRSAWQKVRAKTCQDKQTHEDLDLAIHLHRLGFKLGYSKSLLINASGRRYRDQWPDFHRYMKAYARTYRRHGFSRRNFYLAIAAYYTGYIFYRPWTIGRPARRQPIA